MIRHLDKIIVLHDSTFYLLLSTFFLLLLTHCQSPQADTSAVLEDYFQPYPNKVLAIDSSVAATTLEDQALRLYEQKRYDQAIVLFDELIQTESRVEERYTWLFYKGNAQLAQGQLEKAIDTFDYLPADHPLYEDSRWYMALALLQLDRQEEAREVLKEVSPQHEKHKEARKWIKIFF